MLRYPLRLAVVASAALCCATASAQSSYPMRPARIVVPFAAAGSTDILARSTANVLGKELGQSFVVENRPGASGNIGAETVAKAAPDGYTLLFTTTNLTMNPALSKSLPYDAVADFAPVTMVAFAPMVLMKAPQVEGASLGELVAVIKAKPKQFNFSSSGVGGAPHIAGELFRMAGALDMVHVPYNGAAPALNDVAAGRVQLTFTTFTSAQGLLKGNRVVPVAVASRNRLPSLPEVPTFLESGVAGMEIGTMFGLLAPAKTPPEVVQRLYDTLANAGRGAQFRNQIIELGAEIILNNPPEYAAYIRNDVARWKDLLPRIGVSQ
jgi:tripartite-type tricarboxylate transporter receptor subunit TctC